MLQRNQDKAVEFEEYIDDTHKLKTRVVNLKVCRDGDVVLIDRRTSYGNPFYIGPNGSREEVVAKYREYFHKRMKNDDAFYQQVLSLKGCTLGCWCKPEACHGDVIVEYLDREGTRTKI